MSQLRAWMSRLGGLFRRDQRDRAFAEELESHLQMHIEDNVRAGMTPEAARRDAILKLGGLESTRQDYRERGTVPFVEHLAQDVRFAVRQLVKNPGFTVTAILMLGLGLGASVAIFAFVDAALIEPLPYPDPTRLVHVTESTPQMPRANLSYPDYLDWKRQNTVFTSLAVYTGRGYMLATQEGTQPVPGARVSDDFFRTLGVAPVLGRDFLAGEDSARGARHRDPQRCCLAIAVRRKPGRDRPERRAQRRAPHHRRRASPEFRVRAQGAGGALDDDPPVGFVRPAAKLPRPRGDCPAQGRCLGPGGALRREGHRLAARETVPGLEPRPGCQRASPVGSRRRRPPPGAARTARRGRAAAPDRVRERGEPAPGPIREPQAGTGAPQRTRGIPPAVSSVSS